VVEEEDQEEEEEAHRCPHPLRRAPGARCSLPKTSQPGMMMIPRKVHGRHEIVVQRCHPHVSGEREEDDDVQE
jgi:hypothetical protein